MKVLEKFKNKIIIEIGSEALFKYKDALKVIDECERQNVIILGMDFWQQKDEDIVVVNSTKWEDINSGDNGSQLTVKAAKDLLRSKLPDNSDYTSFVLEESS